MRSTRSTPRQGGLADSLQMTTAIPASTHGRTANRKQQPRPLYYFLFFSASLVFLTQVGCGGITEVRNVAMTSNASKPPAAITLSSTGVQPSTECGPPHYCARTDFDTQPYSNPIPCPSASGCAGGGALTGANFTFTPADFNTPVTRITDSRSGRNRH